MDFSKAFDMVNHRVLWAVLRTRGLNPKLVDLIQDLYADSNASVGAQGIKSTMTAQPEEWLVSR